MQPSEPGFLAVIVSDRGNIFVSQITQELDRQLGIRLHPSTAYHPRTNGQSKISNKAVEQYLHHYIQYRQDNWETLLPAAEFAYNNNTHTSLGVSPFKAN
jgi:transposase InsO family protein